MFGPDEPKNLDPVWSKPSEPTSTQILPWQENLPSFYTNWSPTSTRKLAKPAANWTPTGQPEDPNPVHFNRASPSRSPAIYRRVMFRPQNILSPQQSFDMGDSLSSENTLNSKDNNASMPNQKPECKELNQTVSESNDKTNEPLKSGEEPSVTKTLTSVINESPASLPTSPRKSDESASKPPWRRQPSIESTAMVSIPSKPIQRNPTSPPATQPPEQYQNVPWRSPQSNRKMFAKLKSPSLSIEEPDNLGFSASSKLSQKASAFMNMDKTVSSSVVSKETVHTVSQVDISSCSQSTEMTSKKLCNEAEAAAATLPNVQSTLEESTKECLTSSSTSATNSEEHVLPVPTSVTCISNQNSSSAGETQSTSIDSSQTQLQSDEMITAHNFPPDNVKTESSKISETQASIDVHETAGQSENVQKLQSKVIETQSIADTTETNMTEKIIDLQGCNESEVLNIVEPDNYVADNTVLPQFPPAPPPPPRNSSTKPPKGNSIQELLANVVRYESVDEAREKTHLLQVEDCATEVREPSPEYERTPVTSRIQKFEKQASTEKEPPKLIPQAKPVGPWVKKTSSGHVSSSWGSGELDFQGDLRQQQTTNHLQHRTPERAISHLPYQNPVFEPNESSSDKMCFAGTTKVENRELRGLYTDCYASEVNPTIMESKAKTPTVDTQATKKSELFDPWCDPENPRVIQFQDISAAAFKIKSGIINTPCTYSNMSSTIGTEIFFKKEFNQYTGSFKERGARYTLLCLDEAQKKKGVIAASAGNHALALSYHGKDLGIPVTVVMPIVAPIMKVQACRQYGANVIVQGGDIGECREIALGKAKESGLLYLNGYDHPHILAGQGTMGLEIVEQVHNIDAVVVPVGGGGLIAGVALAVKSLYPNVKVIGVEAERCASFTAAMKAKKPVTLKAETTLADGLAVPCVGVNAFATASRLIDKIVTVKEEWIAIAILRLVEMEKAVVEGAGVAGLAALLAGQLPDLKGKRVVIPLCGGNIDTTILGRCLERGLAADGRLVKFTVTVSDRPGGIAELTRLLCQLGVSIKDMLHERAWIRNDIFSVEVKVVCETRDYAHFLELRTELEKKYERIRFPLPTQIAQGITAQ